MRSSLLLQGSLSVQWEGCTLPQIVGTKAQVEKRSSYEERVLVLRRTGMYSWTGIQAIHMPHLYLWWFKNGDEKMWLRAHSSFGGEIQGHWWNAKSIVGRIPRRKTPSVNSAWTKAVFFAHICVRLNIFLRLKFSPSLIWTKNPNFRSGTK